MENALPLPAERVIGAEGLLAENGVLRLAARLPWYRSLPVSTIEFESLSLDGSPVDLSTVTIEIGDDRMTLNQAKDRTDLFWFILDTAWLEFAVPEGCDVRGTHEVSLSIAIYPPYIPGLRRSNPQTAILEVA